MKREKQSKMRTKDITQIAMTVSAMLVGGFLIYMISSRFPLPGFKYAAMSPYLSFIVAMLLINFNLKRSVLIVNTVFAMVMSMVSIYMGLAIFSTGVLTQITQTMVPKGWRYKNTVVSALYSVYTVGTALTVSKLFIAKEIFEIITWPYVLALMTLAFVLGLLGAYAGDLLGNRVFRSRQS